ncbi:MAG: DUF1660 family phage protein [Planctomycetota bacterium]
MKKLRKLICRLFGHRWDETLDYIDSHGGDDSFARCSRCGELG